MRFLPPAALALLAAVPVMVPATAFAATPIAGRYLTEDGAGVITVGPCGGVVCGKLTSILKKRPGAPDTDVNNSDAALRSRPVLGMPILSEFKDAGTDWRGKIYDPRNGKTYKSIVAKNADGTLAVKGCIAFFCKTQTWQPAK